MWFVRKVVILLLSRDWVDLRTARQSVAIGLGPKRRRCHVPLLENPTYLLSYSKVVSQIYSHGHAFGENESYLKGFEILHIVHRTILITKLYDI